MGHHQPLFFVLLLTGLLGLFKCGANGHRIICAMPFGSTSHKNTVGPLLMALADRGHHVTFISGKKTPVLQDYPNIREIVVDMKVQFDVQMDSKETFFEGVVEAPFWTKINFMKKFQSAPEMTINATFSDPQVRRLLDTEQFDLVIISLVSEFIGTAFAWHFKCPFIFVSPNVLFGDLPFALGDSEQTAYVPFPLSFSWTDRMNLLERTMNTVMVHTMAKITEFYFLPKCDQLTRHYLPGYPSMKEVEQNVSLVFVNSHPSFNYPRVNLPSVIEIGAIHCRPAKPLPKDLEEFVEGSGNSGFFVFTVGSVIQMNEMPEKMVNIFKRAFSRIPQRVIWQWKNPSKDLKMPSNILLVDWLPQQDILGHPKCKGFLTHGGLLGLQEAIYHGVPVIGLPFVSDQQHNMVKVVRDGFGVSLSWNDIDEEKLFGALVAIAYESKYHDNVKKLQSLLLDQPQTPLDRAVYWTEYVLRHDGAPILQLGSRHLTRFQRNLLDVYLILLSVMLFPLFTFIILLRYVYRKLFKTRKEKVC